MNDSNPEINRAILETLAYSDVFDYPLRIDEIHHYLTTSASLGDVIQCMDSMNGRVGHQDGFYYLKNRGHLVALRQRREIISQRAFKRAVVYGRIIGSLPFVRMAALTGSLAVRNCDEKADFDFMLVTAPGRVWLARAFVLLFNRLTRRIGDTICPNLIVSEDTLEWPHRNLYAARELFQMIPLTGMDVYRRLIRTNQWARAFLPNFCSDDLSRYRNKNGNAAILQKILEYPFRGRPGERLEAWEMRRKIARFTQQAGFGVETEFSASVCQGNFQHHGEKTLELFQSRLAALEISD
jgi:hypothetical protein